MSKDPMNSYSYGICEIDHHFGRFCCTWQQLWKAAISCLQLSEDILKRNMKDWLRALLTVAGGSILCWKLFGFFSCTSHHASISTVQFHLPCKTRPLRWSGQEPHSLEDTPQQQNHRHQWKISTKPFLQDAMAVQAKMQKDCFGINLWNQLHYLERM